MLCPWVLSEFSPSLLVPAAALSHGQKGQQAPSPPPVPATLHFTVRVWIKLQRSHTRPEVANRVLETQIRSIKTYTVGGQGNWGLPTIQMSEGWINKW